MEATVGVVIACLCYAALGFTGSLWMYFFIDELVLPGVHEYLAKMNLIAKDRWHCDV